jgi:hypothetical protein
LPFTGSFVTIIACAGEFFSINIPAKNILSFASVPKEDLPVTLPPSCINELMN